MEKNIVIFGAGLRGKKLALIINQYKYGVKILAFCDNSVERWGSTVENIPIISPSNLQKLPLDTMIVISMKTDKSEIRSQVESMGFLDIWEMEEFLALSIRNRVYDFEISEGGIKEEKNESPSGGAELSIIVKCHLGENDNDIMNSCISNIRHSDITVPYEILLWENEPPQTIHGEIVIIVQSTTQIHKESIHWLLRKYEINKGKCAVGSLILNQQYKVISAGYVLGDDFTLIARGYDQDFTEPELQYVRGVDAFSSNGFLFPGSLWSDYINSFLEWKDNFLAQLDFCLKLREAELNLIFQPLSMLCEQEENDPITTDKIECPIFKRKWHDFVMNKQRFSRVSEALVKTGLQEVLCNTLIIEDRVIEYDMHAGGRTLDKYIKLFLDMGMWLVYLPDDLIFDNVYTVRYQQMGILVLYKNKRSGSNNTCEYLEDYLHKINFAFVNRPNNAEKYLPILRKNKNIIITHFGMDLHYLRLCREANITHNSKLEKKAEEMKILELGLLSKVDFSGYPSYTEVQLLKDKNSDANILYFPLYYFEKKEIKQRNKSNKGILFVGSFGHSPNVDAAIWLVKEIVPLLRQYGIKDTIYLAGSNPTAEILSLESQDIVVTGYLSDSELQNYYSKCKVAVVPLRYGAGMKGKVLEGMYAGIPIVVTDIGAEGLKDIKNVLVIANTREEIALSVWDYYRCEKKIEDYSRREQQYIMDNFEKDKMRDLILHQIMNNKK